MNEYASMKKFQNKMLDVTDFEHGFVNAIRNYESTPWSIESMKSH